MKLYIKFKGKRNNVSHKKIVYARDFKNMENKICIKEVNENLRRIRLGGQELTRPLAELNRNCEFKKKYNEMYDIWESDKIKKEEKEKRKKYNEGNKDNIKESYKKYYKKNKDKINEKHRKYNEKNKERINERRRKYNEKNKERIKERRRKYYEKKNKKSFEIAI